MKTVYLLGAGASHGYEGSRTGIRPPLAGNFFSTFYRLLISQDFEVKIGFIVNYLRDITGIEPVNQPDQFDQNIEKIFADLHGEMHRRMADGHAPITFFELSKGYADFGDVDHSVRLKSITRFGRRRSLVSVDVDQTFRRKSITW